ncbi:MAG: cyclic nucleotide-binding domain-containing protein [Deltaproteobacteria bacterium]|nr:MAG: cyclic nucleotide-binding domain-containing protein [Deltaproteobacteria bacterium]
MSQSFKILRSFQELMHLGDKDLAQMYKQMRSLRYKQGTQICREGDDGDSCYLLLGGAVEISKDLPDGRRVHLAELNSRIIIGQTGLVAGQSRTANVKATTDVELLSLHREPFLWALEHQVPWALSFLEVVSVNLVRQIRNAMSRLSDLATSEDHSAVVQGVKRTDTASNAVYINMTDFKSKRSTGEQAAIDPQAASASQPQQEGGDTTPDLLELLKQTDRSISAQGALLDEVHFVDEDDLRN